MKKIILRCVVALKHLCDYIIVLSNNSENWLLVNTKNLKSHRVKFENFKYIRGKIYIQNYGTIEIGKNFSANSGLDYNPIGGDTILRLITSAPEATIRIGNNVGMSNSSIVCWKRVTIGNNVMIGGGVKIWDTNFHSLDPIIRTNGIEDNDVKSSEIRIENYAFIGAGSIILKGVTIGENSIIAAGSVVVKSIPANVIAGGNPCKVIKGI